MPFILPEAQLLRSKRRAAAVPADPLACRMLPCWRRDPLSLTRKYMLEESIKVGPHLLIKHKC